MVKNSITEVQKKLKRIVESHMYKGNNCTKKEGDISHFYIIWKILKNPIVGRPIFVGHYLKEFYSKFENILTDS